MTANNVFLVVFYRNQYLVVRLIRTSDRSYHRLFVPSMDYSYPGPFVPWTIRTVDCSYPGLFVPRTIRTVIVDGLFVPWTIRTVDHSYRGLFVP
jgi:hypothetical protein